MRAGEITITVLQPDIAWQDIGTNLSRYTHLLDSLSGVTDLLLLPEMFSTGFTMEPESVAEEMGGPTTKWLEKVAADHDCTVAGSMVVREDGRYYNRLVCMNRHGLVGTYDKRHLFRMSGEEKRYAQGNRKFVLELKGWRIGFQVCYDLRFPVWSRNTDDYDMMVNVANWPAVRNGVWNTLLKARAIENQSFVVGVNRTGLDGNGIRYMGGSQIIDPKGRVVMQLGNSKDRLESTTLMLHDVLQFREKFPVWRDRDAFELR